MSLLKDQKCPFCRKNSAVLNEEEIKLKNGSAFILSLNCGACKLNSSEVVIEGSKKETKAELRIINSKDLEKRVIKSSTAIIKIPELKIIIRPGENSCGESTTVEKLLESIMKNLQSNNEISSSEYKKSEKLRDEIEAIKSNQGKISLVIEDKEGNSAIE